MILLLLAEHNEEYAPAFSARELVVDWLTRSYDRPDPNIKYAWYDHGTAERLLVLVLLYAYGKRLQFDYRFMSRMRQAIFRHAQLLASEVFYVCHQSSRYHNHGWFQDLALLATAVAFPAWTCSDLWIEIALSRIEDQFAKLIVHDGDYAVFAENSLGYHLGIERLVASIGYFATLSQRPSTAPLLADALSSFSQLMLYPDGVRGIAQGDTFRKANPTSRHEVDLSERWAPQTVSLREAGYVIIKGGDSELPWLFTMLATNKNATHKHEDDLSFVFWLDGVEWLIDPSFHSHDYSAELPSYLRSAAAHNMLHIKDCSYDTKPKPGRVSLEVAETGSDQWLVKGVNRSVDGYEIYRSLRYKGDNGPPELHCSDFFVTTEECVECRSEGVITFHIGDGVEVKELSEGGLIKYELSHPASSCLLTLVFKNGNSYNKILLEPSVSGVGFLESVATQVIRIFIADSVECKWSINVS